MATKNSIKKGNPQKKSDVRTKAKSKKTYEPEVHFVPEDNHEPEEKYEPDEYDIRELAETLYLNRLDTGEPGTAEDDWLRAEAYLRRTV